MAERIPIEELSRQPLVRGTSCFTTADGHTGYKTEDVLASAQVRIAAALERQTELLTFGGPWIPVEHRLPDPQPGREESWAVIAEEYTGSKVFAVYNHATSQWRGIGLDYPPRIIAWLPAPPSSRRQKGGQANG